MGNPKRTGNFAIGHATSASQEVTPKFVLNCSDANVSGEPQYIERLNGVTPDRIGGLPNGFKIGFNCDGAEVDAAQLGYIMYHALGGQEILASEHVLTPTSNLPYLNAMVDKNVDYGTDTPTERGIGGMISSLSLDLQQGAMAQLSFQGVCCNYGAPAAALVAALPPYPLSWPALRAGDFKIGHNNNALASDRTIMGLKLNYARVIDDESGIELDSAQPAELIAHGRTLEYELTRKFQGATALAEYNAWRNQQNIDISTELLMNGGAERVLIEILNGRPDGPYSGPVGAGDDTIMGTMKVIVDQIGSAPLLKVTVKDDTIVDYT